MEPCDILPGNCSAHGVNNLKRFGKCAFRLKKGAVVRKLLHHKVGKVPKNGWWGGGGVMWKWCAPNSATKCMKLLGEHHCITFQLHNQRKDESLKACLFRAPAKCTPTGSQKFHSGGGVRLNLVRLQKSDYQYSRRLVGEPVTWGVWLQRIGCFFLRTQKMFHCAHGAHAVNSLRGSRRKVLWA